MTFLPSLRLFLIFAFLSSMLDITWRWLNKSLFASYMIYAVWWPVASMSFSLLSISLSSPVPWISYSLRSSSNFSWVYICIKNHWVTTGKINLTLTPALFLRFSFFWLLSVLNLSSHFLNLLLISCCSFLKRDNFSLYWPLSDGLRRFH